MTIEYREGSNNSMYTVTTECPYCGEEIPEQASVGPHLINHCPEVDDGG